MAGSGNCGQSRIIPKFGQRVVVLVDEYDKPILDSITDKAVAREMLPRLA